MWSEQIAPGKGGNQQIMDKRQETCTVAVHAVTIGVDKT